MQEAGLKQLSAILICLAVLSFLWGLGALARKNVELDKSSSLNERVEKLAKSNTVLVNDLKETKNQIAAAQSGALAAQQSLQEKEKELQDALTKLKGLRSEFDRSSRQLTQELAELRNTNSALGDELTKAKQENTTLVEELKRARGEAENYRAQPDSKNRSRSRSAPAPAPTPAATN